MAELIRCDLVGSGEAGRAGSVGSQTEECASFAALA